MEGSNMPLCKTDKTLRPFLYDKGVDGALRGLICEIAEASKFINYAIKTSELGYAGTTNVYGERQLALDVLSDELITDRLNICGIVSNMASEEQQSIFSAHVSESGQFSVCFDPLDGSSLVDVNLAVGTIAGIYAGQDLLRPGRELIAAMYVLYGPRTTMVIALPDSVQEFTLSAIGSYSITRENIEMKDSGKIYSPGGDRRKFTSGHKALITSLEKDGYKLRYSGGFVPDINQILMKGGGLFTYPALEDAPNGKLRLLFECNPMAFILEAAGGAASNGEIPILDLKPQALQERCPIYIGSKAEVERAEEALRKASAK